MVTFRAWEYDATMASVPTRPISTIALTTGAGPSPGIVTLDPSIARALAGQDAFEALMSADGDVFRHHKNRRTVRIECGARRYFIKTHHWAGWPEIVRNLFRLRLPVLTARPEYLAIRRLHELGVPTMTCAGFGARGRHPARRRSFIVTEALEGHRDLASLSVLWSALPARQRRRLQRRAIREVALIARTLHAHGLNHRDFYLCHFLTPDRHWSSWTGADGMPLHLIDLHRMQMRSRTPLRWLVKDLSGLLFSVLDLDLAARDYLRFLRVYWGPDWKRRFRRTGLLRRFIVARAITLYRRKQGRLPRTNPGLASSS